MEKEQQMKLIDTSDMLSLSARSPLTTHCVGSDKLNKICHGVKAHITLTNGEKERIGTIKTK
jgi:hypothetical protein